jgi:peptidoglycan L-alanyl-D-glutamate endopeptidase CwlK
MMPQFGPESKKKLALLHPDLQALLREAIKVMNFTIVCSFRDKAGQDAAVASGASKTPWPTSKHNKVPAQAFDFCPYRNGLQWNDREAFYYMAGIFKGIATQMNIPIRWGGDWDGDNDLHNQTFNDLPHIEIKL